MVMIMKMNRHQNTKIDQKAKYTLVIFYKTFMAYYKYSCWLQSF